MTAIYDARLNYGRGRFHGYIYICCAALNSMPDILLNVLDHIKQ